MKRSEILREPEGLGKVGSWWWSNTAPELLEIGILNEGTRADIEWLARLQERIATLSHRTHEEDLGLDANLHEMVQLQQILIWQSHRYGITPGGRAVMERRGNPGTPNPLPPDLLGDK